LTPTHTTTRRQLLAAGALALGGCKPQEISGGFNGVSHARGHLLREPAQANVKAPTLRRAHIVIAGGGVAGLAAARALRQRGIEDFVMLELEDSAGGNSRAGSVAGIACPLGAHYLPVPSDDTPQVQNLLEELGLRKRVSGRWQYDERHLCHSPQERLYFNGHWQPGLLPLDGVGAQTLAQYRQFSQAIAHAQSLARFSIPMAQQPLQPAHLELDAVTFEAWLNAQGLSDPQLRWYLDYACRDDYGAGLASVSAWAGVHYFASRHGFAPPHSEGAALAQPQQDAELGVLTWPQGNGWLTQQLASPLGERLKTGRVVTRMANTREGVEVDALDTATGVTERWLAARAVVALPLFIAARVVQNPPDFLRQAAAAVRYAPWLVANVHIREPLVDRPGAAPAWDNVVYGGTSLGYVNARHQALSLSTGAHIGPTVLTLYRALGDLREGRQLLMQRSWASWRDELLADLSVAHPDLAAKTSQMDITRYGHAMVIPTPGLLSQISPYRKQILLKQLSNKERARPWHGHLHFAHSDWAGYSVFEEAFCMGDGVGRVV
jgi:monoamine oxidase